jgi:hypothetical protein
MVGMRCIFLGFDEIAEKDESDVIKSREGGETSLTDEGLYNPIR